MPKAQARIQSDTNQADAEELLLKAKARSTFLERFNDADVSNMASFLSVLSFSADEPILKKGETASWVGIILSGELGAFVDGNLVGTMGTGTIVGEMAFFTGGERMADVNGRSSGFIALMMTHNLIELLEKAPITGTKLVRALGTSALSQLAYNPRLPTSKPIEWAADADGGGPAEGREEAQRWAEDAFDDVEDLSQDDFTALVRLMKCKRFSAGESLVNRFSPTRDVICILVSGCVEVRVNGAGVRAFDAGSLLQDVRFFEPSLLPYDVVATEDGLLAGIETAKIDELAKEHPLLTLCLLRYIGGSAVDNVLSGLLTAELHAPGEAPLHSGTDLTPKSPPLKRRNSLSRKPRLEGPLEAAPASEAADDTASERSAGKKEGGTKKQRRYTMASASASAEIFYLAKAAKQAKEAEEARAKAEKLESENAKVEQLNRNSKILTAKLNRESSILQEKLEASGAERQSLQRQIRNLKVEVLTCKEAEDKMSRVALDEKKRAERAAQELLGAQVEIGKLRAELQEFKTGDPNAARADAAEQELKRVRRQIDDHASTAQGAESRCAELREELEAVRAELEDERQRSSETSDKLRDVQGSEQEASRLRTLLTAAKDEIAKAKAFSDALTASKVRQAQEATRERDVQVAKLAVLTEAHHALQREARHQRMGAKALGMLYLLRLTALRRKLDVAARRVCDLEAELEQVPIQRAAIEAECVRLRREASEALAAVEPLKDEMVRTRAEQRQTIAKLERLDSTSERLASARRVNSELRTTNEELLEHVRFLTRSLSEMQAREDATRVQIEEREGVHARRLARRDHERRALETQLAEMVSRVREHEKGWFGEPPQWLVSEMKRQASIDRLARHENAPPQPVPTASAVMPSPRWGVALPTVHAASMPVRPSPREPPQPYQAPTPRKRRQQKRLRARRDTSADADAKLSGAEASGAEVSDVEAAELDPLAGGMANKLPAVGLVAAV